MTNMSAVDGFWSNATDYVAGMDNAFLIIHLIVIGLMLTVILPMFYFIYKYSAKRHPKEKTENITHNVPLEIAWTVIPTIILMVVFYYGFLSLKDVRTMPKDAEVINVVAQKWSWTFKYDGGKVTDKLYVPKGEDIVLHMTAPDNDVIHSLWIPAFRTKEDVVPGRTTYMWFNANQEGAFDIECTEYCGDRHAYMLSKVIVISQNEYKEWMDSSAMYPGGPELSSEPRGKTLLATNGCLSCHSMDGSTLVGPSFKGMHNRKVATNNGELVSDATYLKNAILDPNKDIVNGYSPMMPPYSLSDEDVDAIIEYLAEPEAKSSSAVSPALLGEQLAKTNGCLSCHSINGATLVGPSFQGIVGRSVKTNNGEMSSDEHYLKTSILDPSKDVVDGFSPIMPPSSFNDEQMSQIIAYLKTL